MPRSFELRTKAVATYSASASVQRGVDQLAGQIVAYSAAADRTTIAIASFPHVDDTCSELSNFLVDELVLSLFIIPDNQLSIIERSQLGRSFAELELSLSGAGDVNTTRELGRLHVETLLIGSLTTMGDDLRINARLIDTETGQVFSAAAVNIPRTSTIEDLMQRPAAGGCTMMPAGGGTAGSGQRVTGGSGGASGSAAAPQTLSLGAGELESFEQLLGEWFSMMECGGDDEEIWFLADKALANGVSGYFRRASFAGWGGGVVDSTRPSVASGSASLTLRADPDNAGVRFRMVARQQKGGRLYSDSFVLQLVGRDAFYGEAASEDCTEVNLGLRRTADAD